MMTLPENILQRAQSLAEGGVLSPKEFLHQGSRAAVDQAFSRLAKEGKLLRVARGTYAAPVSSKFGSRAPAPEKLVRALAKRSGGIVVPQVQAQPTLGLTQQVPIREVYLTSGRTQTLKLGRGEILVKHAPRWMLALGTRPAGAAVRALAWIGQAHADESLASLHRTLPQAEWKALASARATLPSWMAQAIGKEAAHG
ncbi:MAG: DUF6088 family protein [Halioglobus sp.]|nr:DUF6088 family protein [Halioglobus sp.]